MSGWPLHLYLYCGCLHRLKYNITIHSPGHVPFWCKEFGALFTLNHNALLDNNIRVMDFCRTKSLYKESRRSLMKAKNVAHDFLSAFNASDWLLVDSPRYPFKYDFFSLISHCTQTHIQDFSLKGKNYTVEQCSKKKKKIKDWPASPIALISRRHRCSGRRREASLSRCDEHHEEETAPTHLHSLHYHKISLLNVLSDRSDI